MVEVPWWATGVSALAGIVVGALLVFMVFYFNDKR